MKNILILLLFFFCYNSLFAQDLVILHTNDTHSQIFPVDAGKYKGNGGYERREKFINKIRKENKNVLLLDAGDFMEGTPYFNLFKGKVEVELMNALKYDAVCIGNHELNYDHTKLVLRLREAKFHVLCANYDFSSSVLNKSKIEPFTIIQKGKYKIGIIGVLTRLEGQIGKKYIKDLKYIQPYNLVNTYARILKNEYKCDMVIVLSHLGFDGGNDNNPTDELLAKNSSNVDIIIGGHSHTSLLEPTYIINKYGEKVMIVTFASRGVGVGKIDINFK